MLNELKASELIVGDMVRAVDTLPFVQVAAIVPVDLIYQALHFTDGESWQFMPGGRGDYKRWTRASDAIEKLKREWSADPCWDIEQTPGFEQFTAELTTFHLDYDARLKQEREIYLLKRATDLGCPGNTQLASYIEMIEFKIRALERAMINDNEANC